MTEFDSVLNNELLQGDDMKKLDVLLKHLLESKKISKKQLLNKLMAISDVKEEPSEDNLMNENILEDNSVDESARVPLEASHRHAISNTNSSFYKFRSQDQLTHLQNERPKSSKGGVRSMLPQHHQSSGIPSGVMPSTAGGSGTGHH